MTRRIPRIVLVMVVVMTLAVPLAPAQQADEEIRDRSLDFTFTLDQGEQARLEIEMREGSGLNYVFASGDRRVFFHMFAETTSGQVTDHIGPTNTTSESGTFIASDDGVYVFHMERTQGLAATVQFTVEGEFGILRIDGMERTSGSPAPGVVLVLAAAWLACAWIRRRA